MSKVYEALIVLVLVGLLVLGIVWVADSLTGFTDPDTNMLVSQFTSDCVTL